MATDLADAIGQRRGHGMHGKIEPMVVLPKELTLQTLLILCQGQGEVE